MCHSGIDSSVQILVWFLIRINVKIFMTIFFVRALWQINRRCVSDIWGIFFCNRRVCGTPNNLCIVRINSFRYFIFVPCELRKKKKELTTGFGVFRTFITILPNWRSQTLIRTRKDVNFLRRRSLICQFTFKVLLSRISNKQKAWEVFTKFSLSRTRLIRWEINNFHHLLFTENHFQIFPRTGSSIFQYFLEHTRKIALPLSMNYEW